jgi:DNA-directed RNA polymerase subunit RPC12/RpoP
MGGGPRMTGRRPAPPAAPDAVMAAALPLRHVPPTTPPRSVEPNRYSAMGHEKGGAEVGLFGRGKDKDMDRARNVRVNVANATAMAAQLRAAALQQVESTPGETTSRGAGGPSLARRLGRLLVGPQSGYVKRCTCTVCGAPKKLPSINAYVYCDYCGSLADYDLHRACETQTMPGPEYVRLVNGLQPQLTAARAAGDRDRYRELQRQVFAAYVVNVPMAVSHRARADEVYRDQLVGYLTECGVERAFDPEASRLEQEMAQDVAALRWTGSVTTRQVDADSFWSMTETLARQIEVHDALNRRSGVSDLDPDKAAFLQGKLAWSLFCQGWLPYLPEGAGQELLERTGLRNEYVPIQSEGAESRQCSGCGGQINALPGAKEVVCDGCGRKLDVTAAELTCGNCGATMTFPSGASHMACPYCKVDVERVGIL